MPIATIYSKEKKLAQPLLEALASEWATGVGVDIEDISITVVPEYLQAGRQYKLFITLFLPSLWSDDQVKNIQESLLTLLSKHCQIAASEIFIITMIVQSGHVVENGTTVEW